MITINLGNRGLEEARNLLEYCNHPHGTYWSDLRRSHGVPHAHGIKVWCLGNEMDGSWQLGHKTALEYGRLAAEVAHAFRQFDPNLELVVCGSSSGRMPTFPEWEAVLLDHCYNKVGYISLHAYLGYRQPPPSEIVVDNLPDYLSLSLHMEDYIRTVISACDFAKAKKRSRKSLYLSFDEWNVWQFSDRKGRSFTPWEVGPSLLEQTYTFEDALQVGCMLITLVNHSDRIKIACLSQLVNALAPIMTVNGGPSWCQPTFYPFLHASLYGRGLSLVTNVRSPVYSSVISGDVPYLTAAATCDPAEGSVTLFSVNRSTEHAMELEVDVRSFGVAFAVDHTVFTSDDPKAINTAEDPERVIPKHLGGSEMPGGRGKIILPKLSWNMIRLQSHDRKNGSMSAWGLIDTA
jgi:alpha-N-arabinofuranosidase